MAGYFSPTVVEPAIPIDDMTQIERWLLCQLFEHRIDGDAIAFFASVSPNDIACGQRADIAKLLGASAGIESRSTELVRVAFAAADITAESIEIDMSMDGFEPIFQDIIGRSKRLDHVQIMTAWIATKMCGDGFGGMAMFITADTVETMSTATFLEAALARAAVKTVPSG